MARLNPELNAQDLTAFFMVIDHRNDKLPIENIDFKALLVWLKWKMLEVV